MEVVSIEVKQRQRSRQMTEAQETQILEGFDTLADTIDGFINSQPSIKELDELDRWLKQMQSLSATLAEQCAKAEGFFALAVMSSISDISEATWKRIGKSSTLTTQYVAGLYETRFVAWQRLNSLRAVVKTVMDNTRTMIVTVREERQSHDAGNVRQTPSEPPPSHAAWNPPERQP